MNCEQAKEHWHLFHDSEGDAELHHQINEHLAMCPDCSRWYFQQSRLEDALAEKLRGGQPTLAMWDRIRDRCVETQPATARSWFLGWGLFVAAALVLVATVGLVWLRVQEDRGLDSPDLASLSVDLHEKLASGREDLKFYSDSPRDVENYVQTRVSFPVHCPPREDAGFKVSGGGVCQFQKDPVAYVVGEVEGQRVSVFIMDRKNVVNYPAQDQVLRHRTSYSDRRGDCEVVIGEFDQNLILVVGRVDSRQLTRVLKAYGSYPNHEPDASALFDLNDTRQFGTTEPDNARNHTIVGSVRRLNPSFC